MKGVGQRDSSDPGTDGGRDDDAEGGSTLGGVVGDDNGGAVVVEDIWRAKNGESEWWLASAFICIHSLTSWSLALSPSR